MVDTALRGHGWHDIARRSGGIEPWRGPGAIAAGLPVLAGCRDIDPMALGPVGTDV